MTRVILPEMKTAISLPDELFRRAEDLARQLGVPRSQLYARALAEFLDAHTAETVTAGLNAVYAGEDSSLAPDIVAAQAIVVAEEDW